MATGIRNASSLMLTYGSGGLLTLRLKNTLALQQAALPDGSNSARSWVADGPRTNSATAQTSFLELQGRRTARHDPAMVQKRS